MSLFFFPRIINIPYYERGVNMFKTKAKKMREVVERQWWLIETQLKKFNDKLDRTGVVYLTLIAQKVTVNEILRSFDKIES